jgi:hypothetical protein
MAEAEALIRALQAAHAGASADDVGSFYKLSGPLKGLSTVLREDYQRSVAGPIKRVIDKLDDGKELTKEEIDLVESFVAGDAEAYTRLENDFQAWVTELGRVVKVLGDMGTAGLQARALLDALGEVADAQRVLSDICNYLEEKDRVTRFRRAIAEGIDRTRAKALIDILKRQLESAEA